MKTNPSSIHHRHPGESRDPYNGSVSDEGENSLPSVKRLHGMDPGFRRDDAHRETKGKA